MSYSSYILGRKQKYNTPVSVIFFSHKNVKLIQNSIKHEVFKRSDEKYRLESDQNLEDLLDSMYIVYFDHSQNITNNKQIAEEVKRLDKILLKQIMPDIMSNIKQYYGYLQDINSNLNPIPRPLNVNSAGRRTLPSFTTLWE